MDSYSRDATILLDQYRNRHNGFQGSQIASPMSRGYCVFQSGYQNVSPALPDGLP